MDDRRFNHRTEIRRTLAFAAIGFALLAGCATTPWPWGSHNSSPAKQVSGDAKASSPTPPKSSGSPAGPQTDAQSLQQVMTELQQVGVIDPVAQDKLMADLKLVEPSLWPMVLKTFQAEAAYKRREEQREAEKQKQETTALPAPRDDPEKKSTVAGEQETRFELKSPSPHAPLPKGEGSMLSAPLPRTEEGSMSPSPQATLLHPGEGSAIAAASGSEPMAALVPQPNLLSIVNLDNRSALAPEPPVMGGMDARSITAAPAVGKPSEARDAPPEPPTTAARLAATRSEVSASAVVPTGLAAPVAGAPLSETDWHTHLTAAIRSIEQESKAGSKSESDIALQARLRMLYLLAGRRDDAMRPLPTAPQASRDYWSSQIYGISTWMDAEKTPDVARRAAATKRILSEALTQLGETAPLAVRNLTFCTEVSRFGSFDALKNTEFTPGQKVLLYAEIDNLRIESSTKGYHWSVKINGQIFDNRGNRMVDYGSTSAEEYYQTERHDFFVSKLYYLPRLIPGRYTLQLTIEDTLGRKVGQSSIDFTVKP